MARFDRAIPPGGEGKITLKLKTKGYQGTVRKSAVVYSNDPKHPQIKLAVRAQVKVPISFKPRGVMLAGFVGDEIKQVVTIRSHKEQPLALELSQLSLPKKVAYELKSVEEGKLYQFILRNISKKQGKYSGFITLKTNYPQKPEITVMFLGHIKGNLAFRPGTINFGQINTARLKKLKNRGQSPYQRSVMVRLNHGDNLKIEKIEINQELFETHIKEIQAGKNYRIDVILYPAKLPKGVVNEKMKVYTNFKNDPVKVISIRAEKI